MSVERGSNRSLTHWLCVYSGAVQIYGLKHACQPRSLSLSLVGGGSLSTADLMHPKTQEAKASQKDSLAQVWPVGWSLSALLLYAKSGVDIDKG